MRTVRARALVVAAMLFALAIVLGMAGCAAPSAPPEGGVVLPPPQWLDMCRDRPNPNLCPEV